MDFLSDFVGDVVSDVMSRAGKGLRRVPGRRGPADGGADCALKIISGSQDGLSQHWRLGAAQFAPGALRFTQHGISRPSIIVLGARETTDRVSISPLGELLHRAAPDANRDAGTGDARRAARPRGPGPDAQRVGDVKRLMPLMKLDSSRPGSPATMPGTGVSSSRSMTVISRLARCAPRHKCGPAAEANMRVR